MSDPQTVTATEASRSFSDLLHRVCYGGESFLVKKGHRLMARIVPVEPVGQNIGATTDNSALPVIDMDEKMPDGVTPEEAEYYRSVIEQIRRSALEPCE